ncbi:glutathione S-transferase domain-containing protein [Rhizodiscina lignyota]|uniref:Glutathione S-transferase domain-containing protein n=1 Tax=Rhizodiscina lignyota TaxID=1504668 RepID=A0A9P4ID82_9PEZI|nr:glutathione S-transferase domain-containing protein [Rhizodiscina lignyota]
MALTLISATPSPYARKVRIMLAEKGVQFTLQTEVPWDSTTKTKDYNPLEKLPVLIPDKGQPVFESHFILEWIEAHYPEPRLYPPTKEKELFAKQIQVIADGMCDAGVLLFFEKQREQPSYEWQARQRRKLEGGMKALSGYVGDNEFIVDNTFGLADIAAGSALGWVKVRMPEYDWQGEYPNLKRYSAGLEARKSFQESVPYPQKISDKIV